MAEPREPVEYILVGFRSVLELRRPIRWLARKVPQSLDLPSPTSVRDRGLSHLQRISPAEASVQTPAFEIPLAKWVGVEGLRST